MLQPGEKVVSAVNFRDDVLIVGDRGTVIQAKHDGYGNPIFHVIANFQNPPAH